MKIKTGIICDHCGLKFWQCPNIVFGIIGIITLISLLTVYNFAINVLPPDIVIIIMSGLSIFLLVISFVVSKSLEYFARAYKLKSEFINILSHQIKSPLSNIQWACEIIESGKIGSVSEKQRGYIDEIKESIVRLKKFIDNVILISKTESLVKNKALNLELLSLKDLIQDVLREFQSLAERQKVSVVFDANQDDVKIKTDTFLLKEVLKSVLENAIIYSNENGKVIVRFYQNLGNVFVEIKDNGIGIPEDEKKYIFEEFFRGSIAKTKFVGGSGLGLPLAKNVMKALRGDISFKSKEGKGSTFFIKIPKNI
ncbi:Sensor histidine kinase ResE [bacterium HR34]|nr:Sensor histidine kinase ResE [bacterium HR34]